MKVGHWLKKHLETWQEKDKVTLNSNPVEDNFYILA